MCIRDRFMDDLSAVYPCGPCAESFRGIVERHPVDASSGPALARWMCEAHNEVNKELGKPQFECARVGERWGVCETCAAHGDSLKQFKALMRGAAAPPRRST